MGKQIRQSHIVGETGVIEFHRYCVNHQPYILFREQSKNDFGIDGEAELTRVNEERKIEPTAEIIKIQIKSSSTDSSYIRNDQPSTFQFYPKKDDVQYWAEHKKNGLEVVLVVFDARTSTLYAKKVSDTDLYIAQQQVKPRGKRLSTAITFDKTLNVLEPGKNDFTTQFSGAFKSRVAFGVQETITSNLLKYHSPPRLMYAYQSALKNKSEIFKVVTNDEAPFFVIYKSVIYTFTEIGHSFSAFRDKVLADPAHSTLTFEKVLEDRPLRNHYVELLNEYLRVFLWSKKLVLQKDLGRFYFRLPKDETSFSVQTTTRKRGQDSLKMVVKNFSYPAYSFYRHIALEVRHLFVEEEVYLVVLPKYYFSSDGKTALGGKLVTKLTNFLTSQEYNNHYCDWLHFWWEYLSNGKKEVVVFEDAAYKMVQGVQSRHFYASHLRITLNYFREFDVDFGIAGDIKSRQKKIEPDAPSPQPSLFDNEN
jgi:hypothetical protein